MKFSNKLSVYYAIIWCFWNFLWLVSIYYTGSFSFEGRELYFAQQALSIWLVSLVPQIIAIKLLGRKIDLVAKRLSDNEHVTEVILSTQLDKIYKLPYLLTLQFAIFWLITCLLSYFLWLSQGVSFFAAISIWIGGIAGLIACPWMVLGSQSLLVGQTAELFSRELQRRSLTVKGYGWSIRPKLLIAFISFGLGYTIWLGGMGYFTGIKQILEQQRKSSEDKLVFLTQSDKVLTNNQSIDFFLIDKIDKEPLERDIQRRLKADQVPFSFFDSANDRLVSAIIDQGRIYHSSFSLHNAAAEITDFWLWLGVFFVGAIMVGAILAYTFATGNFMVTRDLFHMVRFLGQGNLLERRGARTLDEIGRLTISINIFLEDLSTMIRRIREVANEVAQNAQQLSEASSKISRNTEEQAATIEETTGSMQEMSAMVQKTSNEASQQSQQMGQVTKQMAALTESLSMLQEKARSVVNSSDQSASQALAAQQASDEARKIMGQIVKSSNDILTVTELINAITEKTNLLALNASIEAARAGKLGAGFAIVAQEITKLAANSAKATADIEELVESSRNTINEGAQKYQDLANFIEQISKVSQNTKEVGHAMEAEFMRQSENIGSASKLVVEVNEVSSQIAMAQKEQNQISDSIASALEDISQRAQQTASFADAMNQNVQRLTKEANRLKNFVSEFTVEEAAEKPFAG